MSDLIRRVTLGRANANKFDEFQSGDTIGVHVRITEGTKERIQLFKGVVLKVQGSGAGKTFTVRKMSSGFGVERIFPFISPSIAKIDVIARGKVRRNKLFYLRDLRGKAARITSELVTATKKEKAPKVDKKTEKSAAVEKPEETKS